MKDEYREIHLLVSSTGSWDSYSEEIEETYLDLSTAQLECNKRNNELTKKKESDEYKRYLIGNNTEDEIDNESWMACFNLSESNNYFIKTSIIKDYYQIFRDENIEKLIK